MGKAGWEVVWGSIYILGAKRVGKPAEGWERVVIRHRMVVWKPVMRES